MKPVKSNDQLYEVLENALQDISQPQTAPNLMDRPDVRTAVLNRFGSDVQIATNRLSDVLGFMWRRGSLDRFPAPPSRSMARWAYALRDRFSDFDTPIRYDPPEQPKLGKHKMSITEKDGEIILDFQEFTILIRPK